jgi:hypothetical protein
VDRQIKHSKPVFESPRDHLSRIYEMPSGRKKFREKRLIFHVLNGYSDERAFINVQTVTPRTQLRKACDVAGARIGLTLVRTRANEKPKAQPHVS